MKVARCRGTNLATVRSRREQLIFALAAVVALLAIAMASNSESIGLEQGSTAPNSTGFSAIDGELPRVDTNNSIDFDLVHNPSGQIPGWMAWVFGAAVLIGLLWFLGRQRFMLFATRRNMRSDEHDATISDAEHAQAVADFADELIVELELGDDPRLAIQRAYANVETGFGRKDLARRPAETPLRYLERVFGRRKNAAPALRTLTGLFEVARFSDEPISADMRSEAVEALLTIRGHYTAGFRAATAAES